MLGTAKLREGALNTVESHLHFSIGTVESQEGSNRGTVFGNLIIGALRKSYQPEIAIPIFGAQSEEARVMPKPQLDLNELFSAGSSHDITPEK
jgi:hypothetical protein